MMLKGTLNIKCRTCFSLVIVLIIIAMKEVMAVQRFTEQPGDVSVRIGHDVLLPCAVGNLTGVIQWTRDGFGLGVNRSLPGFLRYQMIGSDADGNYSLYIQRVLLVDDAVFQCQVSNSNGEEPLRSNKAKLTVTVPLNGSTVYLDKMSPVTIEESKKIRLTCMTGLAKPQATMKWYNGDQVISTSNQTVYRPPGSPLRSVKGWVDISASKDYHKANISCQVTQEGLGTPISRNITVLVKYSPTVTLKADSVKAREGDDVVYTCEAEANPPEVDYRWKMNDFTQVSETKSTFFLKNVTRSENQATVSCTATNSIGSSTQTSTLVVEYQPYFTEEPVDKDADEGAEVEITCNVDGNPTPEIVWTHQDSRKVIQLGPSMKITVTRDTVGVYKCRAAATGYEEVTRSISVFMRGPPAIVENHEVFGMEGDTIRIPCVIKSIPKPGNVTWAWNGIPINKSLPKYDTTNEMTPDGVINTLIITDAKMEDFGTYNCTARNNYGSDTIYVRLLKQYSLPLVTMLVAIVGGILFLIVVIIVITLFKRRGKEYKEPTIEKNSMHSSERSSGQDSVLKTDTRTGSGSDFSPTEDELEYSHDEWETSDISSSRDPLGIHRHPYRYSGDFTDPMFPLKDGSNNNTGGYIPYVDYSRDYNPPLPVPYSRNSIYSPPLLNNMDPRYSAAYGNPYLRVPTVERNTHGRNDPTVKSGGSATAGRQNGTPFGSATGLNAAPATQSDNLNNVVLNNNVVYSQIGQGRNNLQGSHTNSQYIVMPNPNRLSVHGTQI